MAVVLAVLQDIHHHYIHFIEMVNVFSYFVILSSEHPDVDYPQQVGGLILVRKQADPAFITSDYIRNPLRSIFSKHICSHSLQIRTRYWHCSSVSMWGTHLAQRSGQPNSKCGIHRVTVSSEEDISLKTSLSSL